jgi:hypothetical protein
MGPGSVLGGWEPNQEWGGAPSRAGGIPIKNGAGLRPAPFEGAPCMASHASYELTGHDRADWMSCGRVLHGEGAAVSERDARVTEV